MWSDRDPNILRTLLIYFDACCIIEAMNGVRHMYTDFTSIEIYKKHFWYVMFIEDFLLATNSLL